jgi:hypothetical protein
MEREEVLRHFDPVHTPPPRRAHFLTIGFNIILQSTSRSSTCSVSDFVHTVIGYIGVFRYS